MSCQLWKNGACSQVSVTDRAHLCVEKNTQCGWKLYNLYAERHWMLFFSRHARGKSWANTIFTISHQITAQKHSKAAPNFWLSEFFLGFFSSRILLCIEHCQWHCWLVSSQCGRWTNWSKTIRSFPPNSRTQTFTASDLSLHANTCVLTATALPLSSCRMLLLFSYKKIKICHKHTLIHTYANIKKIIKI